MKSNRTKNIRRFSAYKIADPVVPDAVVDVDGSSHRSTSLIGAIGGERGSRFPAMLAHVAAKSDWDTAYEVGDGARG